MARASRKIYDMWHDTDNAIWAWPYEHYGLLNSLIQRVRIALEDPRHPRNPGSVGQVGTSNKDFGRHHRHEVHDAPVKCASCIAGGTGQIDGLANVKGVPV